MTNASATPLVATTPGVATEASTAGEAARRFRRFPGRDWHPLEKRCVRWPPRPAGPRRPLRHAHHMTSFSAQILFTEKNNVVPVTS